MSLKDILVHLDADQACDTRTESAIALASDHEAHLTAVFALSFPDIPAYVQSQISANVIEAHIADARKQGEGIVEVFATKAEKAGLSYETAMVEGDHDDVLTLRGRYADLIVVGQNGPGGTEQAAKSDMPDRLIMSAGRPVLVVPYAGRFAALGRHVVVAWDASRQASRAVNDALPILTGADKVQVLSVNPESKGLGDAPGADICRHLARHGIMAESSSVRTDEISAADMLLSRIADDGADMIVMGAYGHARWRELVLGGFTKHMLKHMTVPVLMSN